VENLGNDFETTLAAAITTAGQTSITVASNAGAPAASFRVRIDDELLLVTANPSTSWTVERGVEGTTATTHSNGATVTHVLTKGGLDNYLTLAGYIYGLEMSNNATDAINDIDVAVGVAASDAGDIYIRLESAITKRLDASWAVGSGNGGLDTGSIANTTYHVWLIRRSDTGVVDVLFSTSATSPTMPANYDQKRRIGSIMRESGAIVGFLQRGDTFTRNTFVQSVNGTLPTSSRTLVTLAVPTGIKVEAILTAMVRSNGSNNVVISLSDPDQPDDSANFTGMHGDASTWYAGGECRVFTNTSAQVGVRTTTSSTLGLVLTRGWVDRRGGSMAQSTEPAATNITLGTAQATTSGTAKDWVIPPGVKRITLTLSGVSTNGSSDLIVQIGDAGGVENTGYLSVLSLIAGSSQASIAHTTGFALENMGAAGVVHGRAVLDLLDPSTNTWAYSSVVARSDATATTYSGGSKALSAELSQIRLTTAGGSVAFDAGKANISWEF